jgi:5-methylthioadenosine/S-adenosylhomocysteine deaminase
MPRDSLKIIANGFVLTCDPSNRGGRYNLLVRDDRIIEISDSLDLFTSLHPYAMVIDASGKLIIPGFVNAHVHSESILLRERTEALHFELWRPDIRFNECSQRLLDPASHDDILSIYLTAYFSHLKSGTTLVAEYGPPVNERSFIAQLQGVDRTDVKSVVTLQNWDQIRYIRDLAAGRPRSMVSVGAEEEYTVYSFDNAIKAAKELEVPLVAQIAEQRDSVEVVKRNFQKGVLSVLSSFQVLQPATLLVHCNHLTEQEVETIERIPATPVVCARSAMRKQTGYPSLRHFASRNIRLCIGTDWGNVDMMKELQFLDELPLLISGLRGFSSLELLRMATINGAFALGRAMETGSIEAGKKADLTFFALKDVRLPPMTPYATSHELANYLIRNLSTNDITDVMIDGEFYISKGGIVTMLEDDIVEGFQKTWEKFFLVAPAVKPMRPSVGHQAAEAQSRTKIIPFVSTPRPAVPSPGEFEEGFKVTEKPPVAVNGPKKSINLEAPLSPNASTEKLNPKPELSKDVKRVFGDDEDFS